jgi:phosphonate transport system substrate-binding protein
MERLRFATFLAPTMLPVYQAVTDEVGRRLGVATELVVETHAEAWTIDRNDVCFICGLPYVWFERRGIAPAVPVAAPVLEGARYAGQPLYYSDVIVPSGSAATSFLDLRGGSWACSEPLSHSGYGITRYHLVEIAQTHGFFGRVVETGSHAESMRLVAEGAVDGAAIDSQVLAVATRDDPSLAHSLRAVDALGPSTSPPVTVSKRLPATLRDEIRQAVTSLHEEALVRERLALGLVGRFVAADPSSYDDVRRMLAACEAAGFMQLR